MFKRQRLLLLKALPAQFSDAVAATVFRAPQIAVSMLATLVTTRVLLSYYGKQTYALSALLFSLTTLLPLAMFGVGATVTKIVTEAELYGELDRVIDQLAQSLKRAVMGAVVFIFTGLAALFSGVGRIVLGGALDKSSIGTATAAMAVILLGAYIPLSLSQNVLLGLRKNKLVVATQAIAAPSALAWTLVCRWVNTPGQFAALGVTVGLVISGISSWIITDFTQVPLSRTLLHILQKKPLTVPASKAQPALAVITIGLQVAYQSDRVVLLHACGVDSVARYSLASQLVAPLALGAGTFALSTWPAMTSLRKNPANLISAVKRSLAAIISICIPLGLVIIMFGNPLSELLSNGTVHTSFGLLIAAVLAVMLQAVHTAITVAMTDNESLAFQARLILVMASFNLLLSWALSRSIGPAGPLIATSVCLLSCTILPNWYRLNRMTNLS